MAIQQDLAGLLTGISSTQQAVQPAPVAGSKNFAGMFGAQQAAKLSGGIQSMTGQTSNQEKLRLALGSLDINKTADLKKLIQVMQATGDIKTATALAAKLQEKTLAATQREGLIKQAKDLGLDQTAEVLIAGGDMEAGTKQVLEQEERNVVARQGRQGKMAVAKAKNAGQAVYDEIKRGKYDKMSDTLFLETMRGEKASLKPYKRIVNGVETIAPYRINEAGKAYDEDEKKWVNPSELGLLIAPQETKAINQADTVISNLTDGLTTQYLETFKDAQSAIKVMATNQSTREILSEGVRTGFGTDWANKSLEIINKTGLLPDKYMDGVAASKALMASRSEAVLASIDIFGGGQGFTEQDRKFLEATKGADASLDGATINRLLDLEERVARAAIQLNNDTLEGVMKLAVGRGEDTTSLTNAFYIPQPTQFLQPTQSETPVTEDYSPETLDLLKRMGIPVGGTQ
tara:strand:- start:3857 stop:5236 length:1380 start_codon:yes stop_codon:yes gene_type:complete